MIFLICILLLEIHQTGVLQSNKNIIQAQILSCWSHHGPNGIKNKFSIAEQAKSDMHGK